MADLIFDEKEVANFLPITATRTISGLRCGVLTLGERAKKLQSKTGKKELHHLWDLLINLKETLEEDLSLLGAGVRGEVHPSSVIIKPEMVSIEAGAVVEPLCVLDASAGPIYIGENTVIKAHACLRGPLAIGPECRLGGEISHSIIQGYTNKAHYGFLGHSILGEWVNLGAGTTNSNLKNTYGTVKVPVFAKLVSALTCPGVTDSKQQFLGCFIADLAKTGIGTLLNTGTVIGVGANVVGGKLAPKHIPNFYWDEKTKWEWKRFIETVKRVYARRGKELSSAEEKKLQELFLI